jgi:glycosyltransferase involved in cell wall biosynthesis
MRFVGTLSNGAVLATFAAADVVVLTSDFEGLPLSLLEAMGQGCVPVVTDIRSGIPDVVVDGSNGYRVPVGDTAAFAERFVTLYREPARREHMAREAHHTISRGGYRAQDMVRRYLDLFGELLDRPASVRYAGRRGPVRPPLPLKGQVCLTRRSAIGYERVRRLFRRSAVVGRRTMQRPGRGGGGREPAVSGSVSSLRGLWRRRCFLHALGAARPGIPANILPRPRTIRSPARFPSVLLVNTLPPDPCPGLRALCRALFRYLESQAPCVYLPNYDYAHSCVSPCLSAAVAVVGVVHSDDPAHYDHVRRLGRYWNAIVAVTPAIARAAAEVSPDLAARMTVIPYGVVVPAAPESRSRAAGAPLHVVYHGRLEQQQKRIFDVGLVMTAAIEAGVAAELTVIGDGVDAAALRHRCGSLVQRGAMRFLGPLPNADALRVIETGDVFLLTSEFEGLPLSLLEAMARGCVPVVADTRSGIPDLVQHGVNGFRVAIGDIGGFVERLASLAADDDLRRRMGMAAHAAVRAAPYRNESMVAGYRALFDTVTERAAAGAYQRPAGRVVPPPSMRWWHLLPEPVRVAARRMRRVWRAVPGRRPWCHEADDASLLSAVPRLVRAPEWWAPKLARRLIAYLEILLQQTAPAPRT